MGDGGFLGQLFAIALALALALLLAATVNKGRALLQDLYAPPALHPALHDTALP